MLPHVGPDVATATQPCQENPSLHLISLLRGSELVATAKYQIPNSRSSRTSDFSSPPLCYHLATSYLSFKRERTSNPHSKSCMPISSVLYPRGPLVSAVVEAQPAHSLPPTPTFAPSNDASSAPLRAPTLPIN